ncbi:Major facilitator superfamily transporter [Nitrosotalea devaniterrae]|uniref:Major facilitator superfamily transporter n=1 Tax=Nitrosotalea devaniterrae TaxID=1078905 RepID=A0A128A4C6_9ARCH|nr:Major facilitator superfamily transporter [Candidatus Nitrosotalea devanaterra]
MTLSSIENTVRKKRFLRIIPLIFALYIITFLDRVNISYAALTMTKDLHFTAAIFGLGAGIFFIGYFVLEIPVTVWIQKWSARKWVARIMIGWGIVSVLTAFTNTEGQFYGLRFALGLGEAGFFPGIILYISHWFTGREKAVAYSMFLAAVPVSQIIGAPLSTHILSVDWLDMQGWRWLFILEGIPSIILGMFAFLYLTDKPSQAKWLTQDEKNWFESKMASENKIKDTKYGLSWKHAIKERDVILLVLIYFFWIIGFYGLGFFLPTIIDGLGHQSVTSVGYLVAIPYVAAFFGLILVGRSSDKKRERKWHAFFSLVVGAVGLGLSIMVYPNLVLSMAMFTIATVGIYSAFGPFWSLPTIFLTETSAAVSIGLINSIGNLGGFIGPSIVGYLKTSTDSYSLGSIFMVASLLIAACLILALKKTKDFVPSE